MIKVKAGARIFEWTEEETEKNEISEPKSVFDYFFKLLELKIEIPK